MMKKTMASALILFAAAIGENALANNKVVPTKNSLPGVFSGQNELRDTNFLPSVNQNPAYSYQNLVYKKRLDAVQKSVPLPYNEYVQSYIDSYTSRKSEMGKMLALSKYYFPIFEKSFREYGIPEEIKYLSIVESALDPNAISRVGATGPWQFMYTTAKSYGLTIDNYVDERRDPVKASYAAAAYFRDAYNEFGDWLLAIAAYNCGKGSVSRAIAQAGGELDFWAIRPYLPQETRGYVPAFIAMTYVMNNYANHDITPGIADFNIYTDNVLVNRYVSLATIAKAANLDLGELKQLNPSYTKQIINGSADAPKSLVIPSLGNEFYNALYNAVNNTSPDGEIKFVLAANKPGAFDANESSRPLYYTVKPGDILADISDKFNLEVQDLKVWNKLPSYKVVPGQVIRLAPPTAPHLK